MIAADGEIAQVVADGLVAWHDPASNAIRLGVELVQAHEGDPISDAAVRSLAWWLRQMSKKYRFDLTPTNLPFHSETSTGMSQGKSDAYPLNSTAGMAFRVRLKAALA